MNHIFDFLVTTSVQIIISIAVLMLMQSSKILQKRQKTVATLMLVLNFVFIISDYIDLNIKFSAPELLDLPWDAQVRNTMVGISYAVKSLLVCLGGLSLGKFQKNPWWKKVYLVPGAINAILSICSIWTKWIYWVDDLNVYHSGSLKALYMTVIFSYFGSIFAFLILYAKERSKMANLTILCIVALCTSSTIFGMTTDLPFNLLSFSIVISIMLSFLSIFMERSNETIHNMDLELEKKQMDLMVSQIQPHFLYNTLSAIRDMCLTDPELAEQTLVDFSFYLRNNLDYGNQSDAMTSVEKELEHTRLYTNIERARFEQIQIFYEVEDGDYQIPFLSIQPVVENAIRHGARSVKNGCVWIRLTAALDKNGHRVHQIEVQDNGTGIQQGRTLGEHNGIGIPNVKSRIEILCHGTFTIQSSSDGTLVTMQIPAE